MVKVLPAQLRTIADYIRYAFSKMNEAGVFFGHGTDNSWDEAVNLVLQSLHLPWDFDQAMWLCALSKEEASLLISNIQRRVEGREPLPYITNQAWFCGYPFFVDERVLVPRSPIAELIQNRFSPWWDESNEPTRVLDLCTGSGCIGMACALEFEAAQVDLVDISKEALAVSGINRERLQLQSRVTCIESNLFASLEKGVNQYNLIVSNPPYVDASDFASMPEEYKKEPELGLVAGNDGLDLVRIILSEAGSYLSENGLLVVEVGNSWVALEEAYPEVPFTWVEFEQGGHGVFVMTAEELKSRVW